MKRHPHAAAPAPTQEASDPAGWIKASTALGAAAGLAALALLWRPMPLLGHVPWPLHEQLGCLAAHGARAASDAWLAAASRDCSSAWQGLAPAMRLGVWTRSALALAAAGAPAALLWKSAMRPRDALTHMRGSRRHGREESPALLRARFANECAMAPDHELAPGTPYPATMYCQHLLCVGSTGSGKSTALRPLIDKVVEAGEPVLLFDAKGEFTARYDGPILLAPWDARSHAWDVARDLRNIGDMRRFAEALIEESQDPMWSNASRQILVGICAHLARTRGSDWGWPDLAAAIAAPQARLFEMLRESHPEAAGMLAKPTVTSQGILINLAAHASGVFDLARSWGALPTERRVSIVDWTLGRSPHRQIILQGHGSYPELARAFSAGVVEVFSGLVASAEMDDDPDRKLWLIADECAQWRMPLLRILELGRSRGARCVLATQDLAQLEKLYGEKEVEAIVGMAGAVLVGRTKQGASAEKLCRMLGAREVERLNATWTGSGPPSLSYARDEVAVYKPSELASRLGPTPSRDGVVLSLLLDDAYELFFPMVPPRRLRPAHAPAAWTLGFGPTPARAAESDGSGDADPALYPGEEEAAATAGAAGAPAASQST